MRLLDEEIRMSIAHWCVLVCVLAPYFLSVAARSEAARSHYVGDPRAFSDSLSGWRRRAHLAHLNAFEATPAILAGVIVSELAGAPRQHTDLLALAFVSFRLLHALLYIADKPVLRSHAWRLGILCVIAMFVDAAVYGR
jgi:uncharacterized MAPEG superfamily protein